MMMINSETEYKIDIRKTLREQSTILDKRTTIVFACYFVQDRQTGLLSKKLEGKSINK
jgi:hypothetical protein